MSSCLIFVVIFFLPLVSGMGCQKTAKSLVCSTPYFLRDILEESSESISQIILLSPSNFFCNRSYNLDELYPKLKKMEMRTSNCSCFCSKKLNISSNCGFGDFGTCPIARKSVKKSGGDNLNAVKRSTTESHVNPCLVQPCKNRGTCNENSASDIGFVCMCTAEYTGQFCESKIRESNPCLIEPCQNGGSCSINPRRRTDFICTCTAEFTGRTCGSKNRADPCFDHPCRNNGSCSVDRNNPTDFICTCTTEFTGRTCESKIRADPCYDRPCRNGGSCSVNHNNLTDFICTCTAEFTGKRCESKIRKSGSSSKKSSKKTSVTTPATILEIAEVSNAPRKKQKGIKSKKSDSKCEIFEWSNWSACSRSCGLATQHRTRLVKPEECTNHISMGDFKYCQLTDCPASEIRKDLKKFSEKLAPQNNSNAGLLRGILYVCVAILIILLACFLPCLYFVYKCRRGQSLQPGRKIGANKNVQTEELGDDKNVQTEEIQMTSRSASANLEVDTWNCLLGSTLSIADSDVSMLS